MSRFAWGLMALFLLSPAGAWGAECARIDVNTLSDSTKLVVKPKAGAKDLSFGGFTLKKDGSFLADRSILMTNALTWSYAEDKKQLSSVQEVPTASAEFEEIEQCKPVGVKAELQFVLDLSQAKKRKVEVLTDGKSCEDIKVLIPDATSRTLVQRQLVKGQAVPDDVQAAVSRFVAGDPIQAVDIQSAKTCSAPAETKEAQKPAKTLPPLPEGWCGEDKKGENVVCVRMGPDGSFTKKRPRRGVIRPNTGLLVYVVHEAGSAVSVTWGGTQGVVQPGTKLPGITDEAHGRLEDNGKEASFVWATSSFAFAPRHPSSANIKVTTTSPAPAAKDGAPAASLVSTTYTVELEVEELSWGAVRFGFGSVFGDAASPVYEIRTAAGANQAEIALASDPIVNFDVTVGFAPYIIDLMAWGGRSHTGGRNAYVAPFVGFGIAGQGAAGVEALNAVYTGLEIEFTPTFSLAGAVVWRKVTSLADGYAVGSPVEVGTSYTTTKTGVGFGLILNVSPDFLQFATPSSKSASSAPSTMSSTTEEAKK